MLRIRIRYYVYVAYATLCILMIMLQHPNVLHCNAKVYTIIRRIAIHMIRREYDTMRCDTACYDMHMLHGILLTVYHLARALSLASCRSSYPVVAVVALTNPRTGLMPRDFVIFPQKQRSRGRGASTRVAHLAVCGASFQPFDLRGMFRLGPLDICRVLYFGIDTASILRAPSPLAPGGAFSTQVRYRPGRLGTLILDRRSLLKSSFFA